MTRTLFLGDLEAQHKIWLANVEPLFPELDAVVQLGNLVSCSREAKDKQDFGRNEAVLSQWEKIPPKRRLRLAGPHELAALNFPGKWTNSNSNRMLRDSWLTAEPTMYVAAVDKSRLLTHGGLTYGEWLSLGRPATAEEASALLQEKYAQTLVQGDSYLLTGVPNLAANPIWADPVLELYASWVLAPEPCPFDQIHGGPSLNTVRGREARQSLHSPVHYADSVSCRKFGSLTEIKGALFRGVDLDLKTETLTSLPADKCFYLETVR